jgi:hypothetical protein
VNITIDRKLPDGATMENGRLKGQLFQDKAGRVSLQTGPYPGGCADFICLHATRVQCGLFIVNTFNRQIWFAERATTRKARHARLAFGRRLNCIANPEPGE